MLIDSHAHLNFDAFEKDRPEVIKRMLDIDVWAINVGSNFQTSEKAVRIAQNYDQGIWASVGLHPLHLKTDLVKVKIDSEESQAESEDFNYSKYRELARNPKVVAIGEIGLDYYWRPKSKRKLALFKEKQKELFLKELGLAKELALPVILHCRMAHEDLLEILTRILTRGKEVKEGRVKGVIHCFTGNWSEAERFMELGFYIGFNGIIFKLELNEVIEKTPLEKILIETDCPYLAPPMAEQERNEPLFVKHVAQRIAELKNLSYKEIADVTLQNARDLFKI